MVQFFDVVIRALLLFLVMIVLSRIAGRKCNTQLTFFDYVTGTTIGSITSSLLANQALRLDFGLISLVVWTACIVLISGITFSSIPARKLIDDEPTMVIYNGQILENNLKARRYNVNNLLMQLRTKGVFDPNEVEAAIIETDGQLSFLKKSQFKTITVQDLNFSKNKKAAIEFIGKELIIDGQIMEKNLAQNGIDEEWLINQLNAQGINDLKEVILAIITPGGKLYVDKKTDQVPDNPRLKD